MYQRECRAKNRPSRVHYIRDIIDVAIPKGNTLANEDTMAADEPWTHASRSRTAQTAEEAEGGGEGNLPTVDTTYREDQEMDSGDKEQ